MGTQEDHASSRVRRGAKMFDALEFRYPVQPLVAGPAPPAHFDQRHAECFEVLPRKAVSLLTAQVRETELEIAPDNRATTAGDGVCEATECPASAASDEIRQRANRA